MEDKVTNEAMRAAAALMGSHRSERKTAAVRENGKLGGAPRRFIPCVGAKKHRFDKKRCRFCGQTKAALRLPR